MEHKYERRYRMIRTVLEIYLITETHSYNKDSTKTLLRLLLNLKREIVLTYEENN